MRVLATDRDQADEPNSFVTYAVTDVFATSTVGTLSPVSAFQVQDRKDVWSHTSNVTLGVCSSRNVLTFEVVSATLRSSIWLSITFFSKFCGRGEFHHLC